MKTGAGFSIHLEKMEGYTLKSMDKVPCYV